MGKISYYLFSSKREQHFEAFPRIVADEYVLQRQAAERVEIKRRALAAEDLARRSAHLEEDKKRKAKSKSRSKVTTAAEVVAKRRAKSVSSPGLLSPSKIAPELIEM